jgi:hypothetical protein
MNRTHWTRIVFAAILLAFLGGCAGMDRPSSGGQQEESPYPIY